jgi:hypothetical protein
MLKLSVTERRAIVGEYYNAISTPEFGEFETGADKSESNNYWAGFEIGSRVFDFCFYWLDGKFVAIVYECFKNDAGDFSTDVSREYFLTG